MNIKKTVTKIKLSKEQLEEVQKIHNREPTIKKTNMSRPRYFTKETAEKRLTQIYDGICTGCGFAWPDYKVSYDYNGATRIER